MKLQVLVDNNTYIDEYYLGEPGVSYYIEADNKRILFDTGYSDIFIKNAVVMGIDLRSLTHIVISHGHNDHANGLKYLPEIMNTAKIPLIAHPNCFIPKWYGEEYIGSPYTSEIGSIFDYTPQTGVRQISENCFFLGEIPVSFDFEKRREIGTTFENGRPIPDLLMDDTALAIKTPNGLFIITGCSHSGICSITEYAKQVCGDQRIAGIIGGFHLSKVNEQLIQTISYLKSQSVKNLYPCHCVSLAAKHEMMSQLNIEEVGVGLTLEI